jgi:hypothetical protein
MDPRILDLGTSWSPGRFNPEETASGTHWIGGWVGPESVWTTWRGETSCPYRDSNCDLSTVHPVASRYTD